MRSGTLGLVALALTLAGPALAQDRIPNPGAPGWDESGVSTPKDGAASLGRRRSSGPIGWSVDLNRGLVYRDPLSGTWLRARGLLALDYRGYEDRNTRPSTLRPDRALLGFDAAYDGWLEARLLLDFRGTDTRYGVEEAWASAELLGANLRLTAGLIKIPLGIEHSYAEETLPFVDYAFPAFLSGRSDLGLRADGEIWEGFFNYDLTLAAGQGSDLTGHNRGGHQVSLRAVMYPFRWLDWSLSTPLGAIPILSGFFVNAGLSYAFDESRRLEVPNSLRNELFVTPRLSADSGRFRHLGYGLDLGPFRFIHEFVRGGLYDLRTPRGQRVDLDNQITAFAFSLAWRVSGEPYDSRPYRQRQRDLSFPARPLFGAEEDQEEGWGGLEVAARYANADIDRDLIDLGFTNEQISSQEFRSFDAAINYYPAAFLRFSFQLTRTLADSEPQTFDSQGRDTSFVVRVQLQY